ncbi:MAG: YkgJ family cysteine cluster protein, partial [Myxococcales bacterium]|nr:YkgJ family cysteine cluster protein [Myxococcales bacterium]
MSEALGRLRRHLQLVDDAVDDIVARHRGEVSCRPGCSDCCHQTFRVTALEGALLRAGLAALPAAQAASIRARAGAYRPDARVACPALDDAGCCQLYAHRPAICRKYGVPLWHPDRPHELRTCHMNFRS